MALPLGKGYYVWQIPRCGSIELIVSQAKAAKINHVFIKIADGISGYNIVNGVDLAKQLVDALKAEGIEAWGWGYAYLNYPDVEATVAVTRIAETGVVGFAIDAEKEAKWRRVQAATYCAKLRAGVGQSLPIGLSSYRFPSLHPELPWDEFRAICNFDMPQVYWMNAHNPGAQLRRSVTEYFNMTPKLPYVPTGAAYREFGWQPTKAEVVEFMAVAKELDLPFNFWEWYDARYILPNEIWDAIAAWNVVPPPPPPPVTKVRVNIDATMYLKIRSSPWDWLDNRNVIGRTYRGLEWEVEGTVKDAKGRTWYKVGKACYLAGWLCVPV